MEPTGFCLPSYHLLRSMPIECGLRFGGGTTRAMVYTDKINLIVETPLDLQVLIDDSTVYLQQCVMKINQAHTVSVVGLGKEKRW